MKSIFFTFSMFIAVNLVAQSSWFEIGIATGAEYYEHDYTYAGGQVNAFADEKKSYGYHLGLRAGVKFGNQFSIRTGIGYAEKHMYPRLQLGFAYGPLAVDVGGAELWDPYLYEHHFKTLEIPLMVNFKPALQSKIKPVFSAGFNGSFQFFESEVYKGNNSFIFAPITVEPDEQIAIDDHSFQTFSVSLDAGIGASYDITKTLSIELIHRFSVMEFRPGNEKWKGNNQMLYEDSTLWLSKLGAELTILKSF